MYLALYRKWRSKTFDDVVGQEPITTTLKNEIKNQKTAHSYLFTGPRGTGKTSCAKIFAMAVNCPESTDGNPCTVCDTCLGIQNGSILDVLEIDAASNNGVDDVRALRDEANYTPAHCKYRVYIIDEAHMLSTSAFNALLKIMEEPPAHVKFILATTEVHKVPATILSRCQRFDFGRIATDAIQNWLMHVAQQEPFTLEADAAYLIARLADGGMRDALSMLDQCTSFSDHVTVSVVTAASGLVMRDYLFTMTTLIHQGEIQRVLAQLDELHANSKDLQRLITELMEHYRNLMIAKTVKDCRELVRCLPEELEQLREQSVSLTMEEILRNISLLQDCMDRIARGAEKRMCVEMTMIKLCSPELTEDVDSLRQRIARLEQMIQTGLSTGNTTGISREISSEQTQPEQTLSKQSEMESSSAQTAPDLVSEQTISKTESIPSGLPFEQETPKPELPFEQQSLRSEQTKHSDPISETPSLLEPESSIASQPLQGENKQAESGGTPKAEQAAESSASETNVQMPPIEPQPVSHQPEPLTVWPEILAAVKEQNPALAGVLSGSLAYAAGNDLFIDSPIALFGQMMKQEGFIRTLMVVLQEKTGVSYRLRIKKAKKTAKKKQNNPLDEIADKARLLGVEVIES